VEVVVVIAVGCTSAAGDFGPEPALHPVSTMAKDPAPSQPRDGRTDPFLLRLRLITGAILPPATVRHRTTRWVEQNGSGTAGATGHSQFQILSCLSSAKRALILGQTHRFIGLRQ
jgi:hypothetical protein